MPWKITLRKPLVRPDKHIFATTCGAFYENFIGGADEGLISFIRGFVEDI